MYTPTPDPFNDQGVTFFQGPVPQDIIDATGETTWEGVVRWMEHQVQTAGVGPNFAGDIVLQVGESGEAERVEVIPEDKQQPPDPPVTPSPEEGAP